MDFKIIFVASVLWMHSSIDAVNHGNIELEDTLPEEFLAENCCSEGEYYSFDDCIIPSDKFDSKDCEETARECCLKLHNAKNEKCESGIRRAKLTKNCTNLDEEANRCCQDCVLGFTLGGSECENGPKVSQICCNYINQRNKITTVPELPPKTASRKTRAPEAELDGCEREGSQICSQKCIPNGNLFKCQCRNGFELMPDGFSCKRAVTDKCRNKCHQKCSETNEKIICSCFRGYELNPDGVSCQDINECEEQANPCKSGRKCVNTVGSYRCIANSRFFNEPKNYQPPKKITCPEGYKLNTENQVCDDIDECITNPCPPERTCVNSLGTYACSETTGTRVPTNAPKKEDVPVSSEEICPPGFRMHPEKSDCIDVDECAEKMDDCNQNSQVCLNLPGSFICQNKASKTTCPPGFKMVIGSGCIDIDECVDQVCPKDEICENINGAYRCLLKSENSKPTASVPDPVVVKPSSRPPNNKYKQQSCPKGYRRTYNGGCVDIDECKENIHSCDMYQHCTNTMGGHRCSCKNGFKKDPMTHACIDINECQEKGLTYCLEGQRCDNTVGSYQCVRYLSCGTGYTLNAASSVCEDDDECLLGTHNCMVPQYYCHNTRGSFKCVKLRVATTPTTTTSTTTIDPDEYYEDYEDNTTTIIPNVNSNTIEDVTPPITVEVEHKDIWKETTIDRETVTNQESSPVQTRSIQTVQETVPTTPSTPPNNQEREIPEENYLNSVQPDDNLYVDTTTLRNKVSMLIPVEKHCLLGYEMDDYGECNDIDECASEKILCDPHSEACQNLPGSYVCVCAEGYTKDLIRKTCKKNAPVYLPPVVQVPRWSPIPHISCDIGMHMDPVTKKCIDIDECEGGVSKCAQGEICVNTLGGYTCKCAEGLHLIQGRCITIMPPAYTAPSRSVTRSSTPVRVVTITRPPYRSHCPKGYVLSENNRCVDVDECSLRIHSCSQDQICVNVAGGYMCRCPKGHTLAENNGVTMCEDIDECKNSGGKVCPHYSTCRNTIGSFRCDCKEGFTSSPKSEQLCMDIDECAHNNGRGSCHQKCINIWGSYRCACDHGFSLNLDNRTCVDIDECALAKRLCVGHCRNTPGNYHCTCPSGYKLGKDGKSCADIDECETGEMVCGPREVCQNTRGGVRCHLITCPPGYTKDPQSSHRCSIIRKECPYGDNVCLSRPDTYSYNFVTFSSKLPLPTGPVRQVDLFTMKGPSMRGAVMSFQMRLIEVKAPPGVQPASIHSFKLTPSQLQASISLVESLTGPQDIHLELAMELFRDGMFEGTAVAKLLIFVSEYDF